jgi:hypothetical protein
MDPPTSLSRRIHPLRPPGLTHSISSSFSSRLLLRLNCKRSRLSLRLPCKRSRPLLLLACQRSMLLLRPDCPTSSSFSDLSPTSGLSPHLIFPIFWRLPLPRLPLHIATSRRLPMFEQYLLFTSGSKLPAVCFQSTRSPFLPNLPPSDHSHVFRRPLCPLFVLLPASFDHSSVFGRCLCWQTRFRASLGACRYFRLFC